MQLFIQQVENCLKQNQNIQLDIIKEYILELSKIIYDKMQNQFQISLPTDLFLERLKTISFKESATFINRDLYQYDATENTAYYRKSEIALESQINIICQTLLEMAYVKSPKSVGGIDGRKFVTLKKGTIEILANNIVQNGEQSGIAEDEQIFVNMANIITDGKLLDFFLERDNKKIEETIIQYHLLGASGLADYNAVCCNKDNSQLGNVEMMLINSFFHLPNTEIKRKMSSFETQIISNPNIMGFSNRYQHLETVQEYFSKLKYQFLNYGSVNQSKYSGVISLGMDEFTEYQRQNELAESSKRIS